MRGHGNACRRGHPAGCGQRRDVERGGVAIMAGAEGRHLASRDDFLDDQGIQFATLALAVSAINSSDGDEARVSDGRRSWTSCRCWLLLSRERVGVVAARRVADHQVWPGD